MKKILSIAVIMVLMTFMANSMNTSSTMGSQQCNADGRVCWPQGGTIILSHSMRVSWSAESFLHLFRGKSVKPRKSTSLTVITWSRFWLVCSFLFLSLMITVVPVDVYIYSDSYFVHSWSSLWSLGVDLSIHLYLQTLCPCYWAHLSIMNLLLINLYKKKRRKKKKRRSYIIASQIFTR